MDGPTPDDFDQTKPGWYIGLMAPASKPPPMAWLDPTRLYLYPEAFQSCVRDLAAPFEDDKIDLVAGIDAAGYVLGAAIALHLKKGFLAIRKGGTLCVETDRVPFVDYQDTEKTLELRKQPFPKGYRVLIVDQWIQTGGTMKAAVEQVENHEGVVAGIAAPCIENTPKAKELCQKYKYSQCVPDNMQQQIDDHWLDSFKYFKEKLPNP